MCITFQSSLFLGRNLLGDSIQFFGGAITLSKKWILVTFGDCMAFYRHEFRFFRFFVYNSSFFCGLDANFDAWVASTLAKVAFTLTAHLLNNAYLTSGDSFFDF
jgi:hypothetical protein